MSGATYAEHQEAAAASLNRLLVEDRLPSDPEDIDQLLHCRGMILDALRQRLYALGVSSGSFHGSEIVPKLVKSMTLSKVEANLPTLLDRVLFEELHTIPVDQRRSPADVIGRQPDDTTVALWRSAAVDMQLASHALDAAAEQPWLDERGAAWYVVRDIAVSAEALMVLDDRLEQVGLLAGMTEPEPAGAPRMGIAERRMIASQCAREATWYATSDIADRAVADVPDPHRTVAGPVVTVSQAADLSRAQRKLARFIAPLTRAEAQTYGEFTMDAHTARMVTASQAFLLGRFQQLAAKTPGAEAVAGEFATRRELLEVVQTKIANLIDADGSEGRRNIRAVWQQGELTSSLQRLQRSGDQLHLSPAQIQDLANSSHEVTKNFATSLRRELLWSDTRMRLNDTLEVGPTRVHKFHPLEAALTDLANLDAPSTPVAAHSALLQRAALRGTLDVTPARDRLPNPFPPARGIGASDYGF